jgi:dihydroflavonol-4-reductase
VDKTLVTGASGFLGANLARALARRGDDLRLLVRTTSELGYIEDLGAELATGDVLDRDSVRSAMRGVERVFHVAGATSMRQRDRRKVFEVNVVGTTNVLGEALNAGVERAVYTSTSGAVGPAPPHQTADESQIFTAGHLGIAYINSKHEAESQAMRLAVDGLPVVCVNPCFVLGPGGPPGSSNLLVRRFLLRQIPAYVEGGINIVDVRDVVSGHLLADERGKVGERYLLGGRNFTLTRLFADLGRLSGVAPPPVKLPGSLLSGTLDAAARLGLPTMVSPDEVRSATQWWTYRSTKAKRELGFHARPHEETLEETVAWHAKELGDRVGGGPRTDLALKAVGEVVKLGERLVPG